MNPLTRTDATGVVHFAASAGDHAGPAVVLLHGLGVDHAMWHPQMEPLAAAGFFVLAPDLPGHGRSGQQATFTIPACAQDIAAWLDHLGIVRAHMIGVSMGGLVAQQVALAYPNRVDKLVLCDSFSGVSSRGEWIQRWLATFLLAVLPTSLQVWMVQATYKRMGYPDVGHYLGEQLRQLPKDHVRRMRAVVNRFDVQDRLPEISAETLVMVGDRFGELTLGMAQRTAQGIPTARLDILPGGGDPSNLLVPETFNRLVLQFLVDGPGQKELRNYVGN